MTQEEKAKRYDDALAKAKDMLSYREVRQEDMEYLFPELAESEDERIRKELIRIFKGEISYTSKEDTDKYVAWLEKQEKTNIFKVTETPIKHTEEVTSRMQYINDDVKPIAKFIISYANWNLHKDEWNRPTLTVPLSRVLDALILGQSFLGLRAQNNIKRL